MAPPRGSSKKAVVTGRTKRTNRPIVDLMRTASERAVAIYEKAKQRHKARRKAEDVDDDVVLPDVPDPTSALSASNRYAAKEKTFERADRHVKLAMQANAIMHKAKAVLAGKVSGVDVVAVVSELNHLLWLVEVAHVMGWTLETTKSNVERVLRRRARDALKAEAAAAERLAGPVTTPCERFRMNAAGDVVSYVRSETTTPEGIAKKEKRHAARAKLPDAVRLAHTRETKPIATRSRNYNSLFFSTGQTHNIMTLQNGQFQVAGDRENIKHDTEAAAILRRHALGLDPKRGGENRHVYAKPSGVAEYRVRGDVLQNLLAAEVFEVEGPVGALVFRGFASRAEAHDFRDDVEEFLDGDGSAFPVLPAGVTGPHAWR